MDKSLYKFKAAVIALDPFQVVPCKRVKHYTSLSLNTVAHRACEFFAKCHLLRGRAQITAAVYMRDLSQAKVMIKSFIHLF